MANSNPVSNNVNYRLQDSAPASTPTGPPRAQLQRRRGMTSPADMSARSSSSLTLPDASGSKPSTTARPPSPLRNTFIPRNTSTGIDPSGGDFDDDDDDDSIEDEDDINGDQSKRNKNYPYQSSSPASSVSQLAVNLAQRVGSFVSNSLSGPSSTHLPSDAELEAEARRERERSRREAERILTREAEERRMAEERFLATKERGDTLPPPPSRAQTMSPSNPSSPSGSPKSRETSNWWAAAKNRLTPTKEKEPLTPAQQVIMEAKAREKEKKGKEKEIPQAKLNDPAMLNLNIPFGPPTRPVPTSPVSPTPSRNQAPNLTPSPMRSNSDVISSPSREAPPIYAQFTSQGTLDVHGTLLTIVKRFEKLEKWTVGHVRALEDRMNDVERWLVEKEKEKEKEEKSLEDNASVHASTSDKQSSVPQNVTQELTEMKEELSELQGRVGELGREMARMGTHRPTSPPLSISSSLPVSAFTTPHHSRLTSGTARDSTSPPIASSKPTGTRLPYPTGDYASPPDNLLSPPHSPPSSLNSTTRSRPVAIPSPGPNATNTANTTTNTSLGGDPPSSTSYSSASFTSISSISSRPLPSSPKSAGMSSHSASSSIARMASPPLMFAPSSLSHSQQSSLSLPPPKIPTSASPSGSPSGKRQTSVSPTPRKRYTVALGEPIVPREPQTQDSPPATPSTRPTHSRNQSVTSMSSVLSSKQGDSESEKGAKIDDDDDELDNQFGEETVGKRAFSKVLAHSAELREATGGNDNINDNSIDITNCNDKWSNDRPPSASILPRRRARPQTVYDFSSYLNQHQQQQLLQSRSSQQSLHSIHSTHSLSSQASGGSGVGSGSVAPLAVRSRWRSQSTERGESSGGAMSGKFVDPLMLRKQGRETTKLPMPKPIGKIPVGELVAFFDGEKDKL